jgi:hypothetical protein
MYPARSFETVQLRHVQIHDDDVRMKLICPLDRFPPIGSFPANLPIGIEFQESTKHMPKGWMVIHYKNAVM